MSDVSIINACHKSCGLHNCMHCAFNVMSAYFKIMHVNTVNTSSRQHTNHKHARAKIASSPPVRKETNVPKSKPNVYKTNFKEVSPVKLEEDVIPKGYIVVPDKNQFFKFARPNQGFQRRSNPFVLYREPKR